MATYQFSALADGQAISFTASADRLVFDQTTIAAADLGLVQEGSHLRVTVKSGPNAGKDVLLLNTTVADIATSNFQLTDGSVALVGDNFWGSFNDDTSQNHVGGDGRDLLLGLGGVDILNGGNNADSIDGGAGNDTINGNNGNDTVAGGAGNDIVTGSGNQDVFVFAHHGAANADQLPDFATGWDSIHLDLAGFGALGATGRFAAGDARFFAGTAAHDADDRIIFNSATGQIFYDADGNGAGAAQLVATLGTGRSVVASDFWVFGEAGGGGGNTINGTAGNDTIFGTAAPDTINGLGGDDSLNGQGGVDSIDGGDGNDTLSGGPAINPDNGEEVHDADTLNGGVGDDLYWVHAGTVIAADAGGNDWVYAELTDWTLGAGLDNLKLVASPRLDAQNGTGNELANVIDPSGLEHGGVYHGMGGNDTIFAAQRDGAYFGDDGDDVIHAEGGNGGADMFGGNGNDTLIGLGQMTGGAGADSFTFLSADVGAILDFASTVDEIHLDATGMSALGASGNFAAGDARFFAGTAAHDADDRVIFDAATGNLWYDADGNGAGEQGLIAVVTGDVVATDIFVDNGSSGGNTINGTSGNDSLVGSADSDRLNGFAGNDTLDGMGGADTLDGGLGDDVYIVRADGDTIVADAGGIDTVVAVTAGFEEWTLGAGLENLDIDDSGVEDYGASGTGNELNNVIRGGANGGTLSGLGGNDLLIARGAQPWNVTWLYGGDGADTLRGGDWSTEMDGGAGDDVLIGAGDNDVAVGGDGADSFVFQGSFHAIADFASGTDKLRFDGTVFTDIGASGNFVAGDARFHAGTAAHDADDRIIYDAASGDLWYDADGNGAQGATLVARFVSNVVATDIAVDNGSGGGQTINGTSGNDALVGGDGNDTINGFAGNDTLDGAGGVDSLVGGDGNDFYRVDDTADVVVETENGGIDTIASSAQHYTLGDWANTLTLTNNSLAFAVGGGNAIDNVLSSSGLSIVTQLDGFAGNDTLFGGTAGDELNGWEGNDSMVGGAGNDTFDGFNHPEDGVDTMDGGAGDDHFFVSPGDIVSGGAGTDTVFSKASWTLGETEENLTFHTGTDDHDLLNITGVGNALNNVISAARAENSTLDGKGGNDTITGDELYEDDFLFSVSPGAANADVITNFIDDKIVLDGAAHANSGPSGTFAAGDSRFWASAGANSGHDADDRVVYNTSSGQLWYDADGSGAGAAQLIATLQGAPTLDATNIAILNGSAGGGTINGTAGNDTLTGGSGNDTLNGLDGDDRLIGNGGDDRLDGGAGIDTLDGGLGNDTYVLGSESDTLIDAGGIDTWLTQPGRALASGFENMTLLGTANGDASGNSVANVMIGNSGNNALRGRDGNDTLTGGGGNDFFDFVTAPSAANADTITDFVSGVDRLRFEDFVHAGIGATGSWSASDARFWASSSGTAHDATDRVLYNTATGQLYYDADGSGSGAAQLVATLQGAPTISATDITVI